LNTMSHGTEFGSAPIPCNFSIFPIPELWLPACYLNSKRSKSRRQTPA